MPTLSQILTGTQRAAQRQPRIAHPSPFVRHPDIAPVVVLPHVGEFGWFIMCHVRYCYALQVPNIVCCLPGQEALFPRAEGFDYDWQFPQPDSGRHKHGNHRGYYPKLAQRLHRKYGRAVLWPEYGPAWRMTKVKFLVTVEHCLPPVDVTLGYRHRAVSPERNWQHWEYVKEKISERGLTWAAVGQEIGTRDSIDLMQTCRVFMGGDSGLAHLASLMDIPIVLCPQHDGMTHVIKSTRGVTRAAWDNPDEVVEAICRACNK